MFEHCALPNSGCSYTKECLVNKNKLHKLSAVGLFCPHDLPEKSSTPPYEAMLRAVVDTIDRNGSMENLLNKVMWSNADVDRSVFETWLGNYRDQNLRARALSKLSTEERRVLGLEDI